MNLIYLGETDGTLTQTAPSDSGDIVQTMASAISADILLLSGNLNYSIVP